MLERARNDGKDTIVLNPVSNWIFANKEEAYIQAAFDGIQAGIEDFLVKYKNGKPDRIILNGIPLEKWKPRN